MNFITLLHALLIRHKSSVPIDRDQMAHDWHQQGYS